MTCDDEASTVARGGSSPAAAKHTLIVVRVGVPLGGSSQRAPSRSASPKPLLRTRAFCRCASRHASCCITVSRVSPAPVRSQLLRPISASNRCIWSSPSSWLVGPSLIATVMRCPWTLAGRNARESQQRRDLRVEALEAVVAAAFDELEGACIERYGLAIVELLVAGLHHQPIPVGARDSIDGHRTQFLEVHLGDDERFARVEIHLRPDVRA